MSLSSHSFLYIKHNHSLAGLTSICRMSLHKTEEIILVPPLSQWFENSRALSWQQCPRNCLVHYCLRGYSRKHRRSYLRAFGILGSGRGINSLLFICLVKTKTHSVLDNSIPRASHRSKVGSSSVPSCLTAISWSAFSGLNILLAKSLTCQIWSSYL